MVAFDQNRITHALSRAMQASREGDLARHPALLCDKVVAELNRRYPATHVPQVEEIQDLIEETLILKEFAKTAKAYILYRHNRAQIRAKAETVPDKVKRLTAESKPSFPNALAEFIYYRTYSRWLEEENRRETWLETVHRYMAFMEEQLGQRLSPTEYRQIRQAILQQRVMPSMRLLWSAGKAARVNNVAAYNCSFVAPTQLQDLAEILYLLMSGVGVGFSVESQNVQRLPIIQRQTGEMRPIYQVGDSKEGWGEALKTGLQTWYEGKDIRFDYSQVRPAGSRLHTMGGRSAGPEPLRSLLEYGRAKILNAQGRRLRNIDVHDLVCKIGAIVEMGGVRRAALISLSDADDEDMRQAKSGHFYITQPQRAMANNSAVYENKPKATEFLKEWLALAQGGTGERGLFNRGSLETQLPRRRWDTFQENWRTSGTNPCLTGEALVYVADGRGSLSIRQLAEEGKDVPVFCLDRKGKVVVRMMRNPRLTGTRLPVYQVTLDDGSRVKTTVNHQFRLQSGGYKKVKELQYGDSFHLLTKFEASGNFAETNAQPQAYGWLRNGQGPIQAERRLIAAFHNHVSIPENNAVYHQDKNVRNNDPFKRNHGVLHGNFMAGSSPMTGASSNTPRARNGHYSGLPEENLKVHALLLTKTLGRRFSNKDWGNYAKEKQLPHSFSKWRKDHLGGILGVAKWAAQELGLEHIKAAPAVIESYRHYTFQGYDCEISNGQIFIIKRCEVCRKKFRTDTERREHGICGIACGLKRQPSDGEHHSRIIKRRSVERPRKKDLVRGQQAKIYADLKPLKKESVEACKTHGISSEISRKSASFRNYTDLQAAASMSNHKVVSVEFWGWEDVYNGTVDEFHNFFIGGFKDKTSHKQRKISYINNRQCGEIILGNKQFCNLTEVVARPEDTEETLLDKIRIASLLGTYQSMLTDFPYLSPEWKKNCEQERLLGVSLTGQWDSPVVRTPKTLRKLRDHAIAMNRIYAKRLGINAAAAVTCVKPSGTVSQLVNAASGMHPRYAPYYLRRVRISAQDPLFAMLKAQKFPYYPEVGQDETTASTFVLEFPVRAPEGSITRAVLNGTEQLEYWRRVKENYTEHNPSVTIAVAEEEWIEIANWLYNHWDIVGGLSFLPRTGAVYPLAPFEEITAAEYQKRTAELPEIDFSRIVIYEKEDTTRGAKELACSGSGCEIDPEEGSLVGNHPGHYS